MKPSKSGEDNISLKLSEEAVADIISKIVEEINEIRLAQTEPIIVKKEEDGLGFEVSLRLKLKAWLPVPEVGPEIQKKIAEAFKLNSGFELTKINIDFTNYFED